MNGRKVRIITTFNFHAIGYSYLRKLVRPSIGKQLLFCCKFIIVTCIAFGGSTLSILIQLYPAYFLASPKIYNSTIPIEILDGISITGYIYALCALIVLLPHLKQCCGRYYPYLSQQHQQVSFMPFKHLVQNSRSQLDFQFTTIVGDISNSWKLRQYIKLLQNSISFMVALPFILLARLEIVRIILFITDALMFHLRNSFIRTTRSSLYRILSSIFFIISLLYSIITVCGIWLLLQLLVRVVVTSTSFIIAHSIYFSSIIIIIVAYLHYVFKLIDAYRNKENMLPENILNLQDRVMKQINNILNAKQGKLDVYFTLDYSDTGKKITIDVPEMLKDDKIQEDIRTTLQDIINTNNVTLTDEISKIIFQYVRISETQVDVTVPQSNEWYLCCDNSNNRLQQLARLVGQHLEISTLDQFRSNLTQVYYRIEDIDDLICTAIPSELFTYLRYYAPKISLNLWRIFFNIIITTGIFLTFILTVSTEFNLVSLFTINAAIANAPIMLTATNVALKYLMIAKIDQGKVDKILLTNLVRYARGYTFFCTRGIEFRPFIQLKKIFQTSHHYSLSGIEANTQSQNNNAAAF